MKIEILGTGCPKCEKLAANAKAAAEKLGLACEFSKVTEINEIMKRGVMLTPALTIDGKVEVAGKVAAVDEITTMLANHAG
ncbi:MAG: TM0996/MTH895 family glutaredoxin-like protein [Phycisphaerae bacterium]|nr:TM0996/MTH895 family glutaredoxin-like protein [Phycisphaerae bacterium]